MLLPLGAGANPASGPGAFSQSATGAITAGVVPDGTCRARVTALGGSGGSPPSAGGTGGRGAAGAQILATFGVLPQQSYGGSVGGGGGAGVTTTGGAGGVGGGGAGTSAPSDHSGAGGGGRTVVTLAGQNAVIAGGGGGGGAAHGASPLANGGSGGTAVSAGGVGAGVNGSNGADNPAATVGGGTGGLAASGGAGGVHSTTAARNGTAGGGVGTGTGGAGGSDLNYDGAGGGGAGYTGGGGGAATVGQSVTGAGGGGGSSWVAATSPTASAAAPTAISGTAGGLTAAGTAGANGSVSIDWLPCVYDLTTTKTVTPNPVNAGQSATWTITITNGAGSDAMTRGDTIDLTDTLPGPATSVVSVSTSGGSNANLTRGAITCTGVTPGSPMPSSTNCSRSYSAVAGTPGSPSGGARGLDPGETLTIVYTQAFPSSAAATTITNTATVQDRPSQSGTTDVTGNVVTDTVNTPLTIQQRADLRITKTASAATIGRTQALTYTLAIDNLGPSDAAGVTAVDVLPAGMTFSSASAGCVNAAGTVTCTIGALAGGASTTRTITVTATTTGVKSNTATVTGTTTDPDSSNNSSTASATVTNLVNLATTKTVSTTTPAFGSNVTFTVSVSNSGPDAALNTTVNDLLPAGLTFVSATPSVGSYNSGTGVWTVGTLNSGGSASMTLVATVNNHTALTNTATASTTETDSNAANNTASATVDVPDANLGVSKTVSNATPDVGASVTFTIALSNAGPDAAQSVSVSDLLPAGLSFVSATPSTGSYNAGTGVWTVGTVNAGATPSLQITAIVTTPSAVTNAASVSSSTYDPTSANNSASVGVNALDANLGVSKTVSNATPNVGQSVTFTVALTNAGPDAAQSVSVSDLLPAGLSFVSATPSTGSYNSGSGVWTVGTVNSGATPSLQLVATVTTPNAVTNTAQVFSTTFDTVAANNTASVGVNALDANLGVTKTVSNATPNVGANVTFTISLSNTGPDAAQAVSVSDLLPAGLTFVSSTPSTGSYNSGTGVWTVGTVNNGATPSLQITATVTTPNAVTNTATATSTTYDTVAGNNTASVAVNALDANLAVTKTVSNATPVVGANVTFTVGLSNAGPDAAQAVTVNDLLPAGLSFVSATPSTGSYNSGTGVWTLGTVNNGATPSLQITATVTTHTALTNTATASSTTYDPVAGDNTATVGVNALDANLGVTKTVSNATPDVGASVTFTIALSNAGPDAAQSVSVSDLLPAGLSFVSATPSTGSYNAGTGVWTVGTVNAGATPSLQITATVTTPSAVTNTAAVSSTTYDPTSANNSASVGVNALDANLGVTKTVSNPTPDVGANVTFTIGLTNGGPDAAQSVTMSDLLPAGLTFVSAAPSVGTYNSGTGVWTVGSVASGATPSLQIVATVTTPSAVTNTAQVFSSTYDPVSGNNSASVAVNALDADVAVTKTVSNAAPNVGANVTFTIGVSNSGADTAQSVSVSDALPAGLSFVSATPSTGSYNSGSGVWTVGNLANGASASLQIVATVTTPSAVTNTATVSSSTYDPVAGNNSASVAVNALDANLGVSKTVSNATPDVGANVTFTVALSNAGPDAAQSVSVADLLPAGLTFVSATPSTGSYNSGTGVWTVGTVASGATPSLQIVATVTQHTAVSNTAAVSSTTYDPVAGNNSASVGVNALDANVGVSKSVSNATPDVGANVTFTVALSNAGPDAAQAVSVADLLPAGLTYVSSTPSTGSYNSGTGVWTVGTVASGATPSLQVVATVTSPNAITNSASVSSSTYDPTSANNTASVGVNALDANLAVSKTVSNATPDVAANVTFTVGVSNAGPDAAQAVTVSDLLPAGLTYVSSTPSTGSYNSGTGVWTVGTVATGATPSLQVVATVTSPNALTNTAQVFSTTYDPVAANNSASVAVNALDANLAVTKTVSNATPALNSNVTFTVTVANSGPDVAQSVSVADLLPAGLSFVSATPSTGSYNSGTGVWTVGSVANGAAPTLQIVATVTQHTAISNTATVSSSTYDPVGGNNSASSTVNVPDANLGVSKTVSNATPNVGANVTFTVALSNAGPDAAQAVTVADTLPAGLAFVSATPSTGTYNSGTGVWTVGTVNAGATPSLQIVATVTQHTAITNTATLSSTTYDPVAGNNSASASVNALDADLVVTKTVDNSAPALGGNVTYTVNLTNNGPDAAQAVSVADALPAGLSLVSATPSTGSYGGGVWTVGSLAGGASATLQIVATVTSDAPITNTATATSPTYDPVGGNNSSSAVVDVPNADLAVTKTVSNASPALGGNVTFTISVTNNGPNTAQSVTVTDALPPGLSFVSANPGAAYDPGTGVWTIGALANGATTSLDIVATVTAHTAITNTATVSSPTRDVVPGNDSASALVNVPDADLAIAKAVSDPTPEIGANVTFTLTVANNGPDAAQSASATDLLPSGLAFVSANPAAAYDAGTGAWTIGSLASGATATLDIVATVTVPGAITNAATVTSSTYDPAGGNNSASATVNGRQANLAVAKTVDDATPALGANVTFTVTVTNAGPSDAGGVSVADALPAGLTLVGSTPSQGTYAAGTWNVGTLANGASATLQIVATATVHTALTNTATVSSTTHDPVPGNNSASAVVNAPDADLAVTKTVSDPTPAMGDIVTFTVTVTNNGPDAAQSVAVADALPSGLVLQSANPSVGSYAAGTWTVGTLANGASANLQVLAQVTSHTALTNTASASAATYDPAPGDNSASAGVNVPDADLAVTKTVDNPTPAINGNVTFTVTLTNNGPDTATGVTVGDALPAGLTLVSATPSAGTYASDTWNVGNVANGTTRTLTIVATVTAHTQITNTATASATTYDPVGGNNAAGAPVNVPDADLAVTKTVSNATPAIGGQVTFTVTVGNNGPDAAQGVSVADALPAGLALVSATPSQGSYAGGVWTVGALANGASATLDLVATVTTHTPITNTATVSAATYDPTSANDFDSASVDVPDANLAVGKTVDDATPDVGDDVVFTVTVTNGGPDTAQSVAVADALPAGLSFVSALATTGSYNPGAGTWTVGDLASGASATLTLTATVTTPAAVTNTATATSSTSDPTPANNGASAGVDALDADLAVTKTVSDATPAVGANVTFTVAVANTGPNTARNASVADSLPAGLSFVSASTATGAYDAGTGVWTLGNLAGGTTATLDIVATVTVPNARTNTATATSSTFDPNAGDNSDSATVDARDADLAVAKTVSDPAPAFGGQVTFTVTVTNNGPDAAGGVSVADALPGGLAPVSTTASQGTYGGGTWTAGSLANGAAATLQVVADVNTHLPRTNTATASASTFDPNAANDSASATVDVPDADLAIAKAVDDPSAAVGSDATFTLTVTNNGADDATGVTVTDALPAGLTFVSASSGSYNPGTGIWSVGNLASGAATSLQIVATVTTHTPITNTATVTGSLHDPVPGNNDASATVDAPNADLAVTKTVSDATPALGSNVTFTVGVTNNGPDAAPAVSVADALPAGLTLVSATPSKGSYAGGAWTVGALANGASATLAIVATVTTHAAVTNTATASSGVYDPAAGDNSASATVNAPDADLAITKGVDDATPAVGGDVTFTLRVANNGPDAAQAVTVADVLPAGLAFVSATPAAAYDQASGRWTVGALANGQSATLQIVATVTQHAAITNAATVSSTTFDPVSGNDAANATVDAPDADLAITKSVSSAIPAVGGNVTFTLQVTNNGPDAAQAVTVADVLPAGLTFVSASPAAAYDQAAGTWTIGALANGATASLDIVATVTGHTAITNTGTVSSTTFDPVAADNSASSSLNAPDADLTLTKTVDDPNANVGGTVTFTLQVANNGPDTARAVTVVDSLPVGLTFVSANPAAAYDAGTGTWTVGDLANGASATLDIVATVAVPGTLTNSATATSTTFDPATGDNAATATVNAPPADLRVAKTVSSPRPALGSNVTFTITVTNDGPQAATGVVASDALPAGLTFVSASPAAAYDQSTGTWAIGGLANGGSAQLQIVARVDDPAPLTNTATVSASTYDPDAADNSASATVDVPEVDLTVSNTVSDPTPALNGNVVFTVDVTNLGPDQAAAVRLTDLLPAGLTFVSSDAGAAYDASTGVWTIGALNSGAGQTIKITAKVTDPNPITTTATASTTSLDTDSANDSADAGIDVPDADLAVTNTVDNASTALGANVVFTVTVTNNGPLGATGVRVSDLLPSGLTFVSSDAGGAYDPATGVWAIGALANGGSVTMHITATVNNAAPQTTTATVSTTSYDTDAANDSMDATVDVPQADLAIVKTVSDPTPTLGGNVTFTLQATNNGPNAAQAVSVVDNLPAGLAFVSASSPAYAGGTWTIGNLVNGASATLDIVATVTDPAPITNTATVNSPTLDTVSGNDSDTARVDVPEADLALTKTVSDATPSQGANVTYTVSLTNGGPDAAGAVEVTDNLPAGLTFVSATPDAGTYSGGVWTLPSVPSGATRRLRITARVDVLGLVTNAAEVTSAATLDPDSTPNDGAGDDSASVDITGQPPTADLSLTMGVSDANPQVGGTVTYTLTVANAGPAATGGVSVIDLLPGGVTFVGASASAGAYDAGAGTWTVGGLASGASATLDIVVRVDQVGSVANSAEVGTSSVADPDSSPANGSGSEDDEATRTITVQATAAPPPPPPATTVDLEIVKSTNTAQATVGDSITYAIVVTNEGTGTATNVSVLDQLPLGLQLLSSRATAGAYDPGSGVWSIPAIGPASSATLAVTTRVLIPGTVTNTARIAASDQPDVDGSSPSSASIAVTGPAPTPTRLSITKSGPKVVRAGGTVTFTIAVKNIGAVPATNVVLVDCIPGGLSVAGGLAKGRVTKGRLGWRLGTLRPGQMRVVRVRLRVDPGTRGVRGCFATVAGANASPVRARARVRVIAGTSAPGRAPVTG